MVAVAEDFLNLVMGVAIGDNRWRWTAGASGVDTGWITERTEMADMENRMNFPCGRQLQLIGHRRKHSANAEWLREPGAELP